MCRSINKQQLKTQDATNSFQVGEPGLAIAMNQDLTIPATLMLLQGRENQSRSIAAYLQKPPKVWEIDGDE